MNLQDVLLAKGASRLDANIGALAARGSGDNDIARELGIHSKEVRASLKRIYPVVGASSRKEFLLWVGEHQLFDTTSQTPQAIKAEKLEIQIKSLLRNGLTSKSGMTLAGTDVLKEIAKRLGYTESELLELEE